MGERELNEGGNPPGYTQSRIGYIAIGSRDIDFNSYANFHRDSGRKFTLVRKVIEETTLSHTGMLNDVIDGNSIDGLFR